jgi:signal transduction histidine kinase
MNISEINVLSPDEIKGEMDRVMRDECKYFNFRHRIASGEIRDVEVFSSPVFSDGVSSLYSIIHDITERKIAEEEIQRKSAELQKVNNEKDLFFSIIAHDLRSPFNAFLGFTQIMAEELESLTPEEIRKIAVAMRKSATNLFGLLENLLEWSRLQRGLTSFNPEAFLLRPKISSILQTVVLSAEKKGITLTIEIPDWLEVFFDPNHMGSIIRNLAFNAVKFTEAGGKINISGRLKAGNRVEIAIRDTGIGMTKEMLDKLFQLDNQSNRRGTEGEPSTGLGLIICRDLIKMGGGEILVESEERKGSVFSFTVPATRSGNLPGT